MDVTVIFMVKDVRVASKLKGMDESTPDPDPPPRKEHRSDPASSLGLKHTLHKTSHKPDLAPHIRCAPSGQTDKKRLVAHTPI